MVLMKEFVLRLNKKTPPHNNIEFRTFKLPPSSSNTLV